MDDKEIEFSEESFGNGVGVYFVVDQLPTLSDFEIGDEVLIHGIGNIGGRAMYDNIFFNLLYEFEYFKHYNYETKNAETKITYCVRDAWQDGCEEDAIITIQILKTLFDWKSYDKPYWWGKPENEESESIPKTIENLIQEGENNKVEFKSTLHIGPTNFNEKIAKTICAFSNSNGGVLFIGIRDDKAIEGLDFDFSLAIC